MKIITDVNGTEQLKYIVINGSIAGVEKVIRIPVHDVMILDVIDQVKKLSVAEHELIIRDGDVTVPPGVDERELLYLAMSFVQNAWYDSQPTNDSAENVDRRKKIADGHAARLVKFEKAVEKAIKNPPVSAEPKAAKAPKEPKAAKAPKEPKAPKQPSVARIVNRVYSVNPHGDVAIIASFKGFRKGIYEALRANGSMTMEQVIALGPDVVGSGKDGGKSQAAYQLKELVAMQVALLAVSTEATPEVATPTTSA